VVLGVAYGGVSLWRAAGQLNQASTSLVGRIDTQPREALPARVEPASQLDAPDGGASGLDASDLDAAEPAVFDAPAVADAFSQDAVFDTARDEGEFEEPAADFEEPGFASTSDESFLDPSLEYAEPFGDEPLDDEQFADDLGLGLEGRYEEDRTVEETFGEEEPADDEAYADEADPSLVLQALINDPDPAVRDEAARILQEIETERRQSLR
jgi:hypothetical protein